MKRINAFQVFETLRHQRMDGIKPFLTIFCQKRPNIGKKHPPKHRIKSLVSRDCVQLDRHGSWRCLGARAPGSVGQLQQTLGQ
jgi:hypothetical protein